MLATVLGIFSPKISATVKSIALTLCGSLVTHGYMSHAQEQYVAGTVGALIVIALNVAANAAPALLAKASQIQGSKVSTSNFAHATSAKDLGGDVATHMGGTML